MKTNQILGLLLVVLSTLTVAPLVVAQSTQPDLSASVVTQYPDPARAGDVVELRLRLENRGTKSASPIIAEILDEYPFTLLPGQTRQIKIDNLPYYPKEANFKTLLYKLRVDKNANDGEHEVKFRYSQDAGVNWVYKSFTIDLTSKEFAQIIHVDKSQINPGQETPITFTINNIGKAPLTNMIFTWQEKDNVILPINTDNTRYIPYLGIDENIELKYTVIADPSAVRGLYNLDLSLTFDSQNSAGTESEEIKTKAGVLVGGATDFDVAFAETNNGKTSFTIANIGENDASSVTISIPEQESFTVRGGESVIIGNLNKGDFTLATFQLIPKEESKAEGSKSLAIALAFTDSFGKRHTANKEIALKIYPGFGQDTSQTEKRRSPISTFVVVVIVVGGIYYVYKRRKNGKPIFSKTISSIFGKGKT